ncbi:MAG: hypothetical protein ACK41E_03515 [Deinococcales bacterium]
MRNLLEPKKVSWKTRSKAIFAALCVYSALETMQLLGVVQNADKFAVDFATSPGAVAWRAGILGVVALLAALSAAAATWSIHTQHPDWHKAHGMVTGGIYTFHALLQLFLAIFLVSSQTQVSLVLCLIYLVFALMAFYASTKAASEQLESK